MISKLKAGAIFLLYCLLNIPVSAQTADSAAIRTIVTETLQHGKAYENLRLLCKDIGPRLSGSEQAAKAVEATRKMLIDAGADTVYLQPCMVPHWMRGEKENGFLKIPGKEDMPLALCALGNSVATPEAGILAEVIEVSSMEQLHQLGEPAIKGKWVFFNIAMDPAYIQTFTAYGKSGIGRRIGPAQASKYGAIGVMVRSLASNVDDYPHTGVTQYNDSFPKIPAVAISTRQSEYLSSMLKKGKVSAWIKTSCKQLPDVLSYNVIGELLGGESAKEIITVGGHLDSWDLGEGAQDDGAGCVQSIEVIRILKALNLRPKRTIRAVMFMNEENGGRGAEQYLSIAIEKNEQHLFALESDAGGFSPKAFSFDVTDSVYSRLMQWQPWFVPVGTVEFRRGGSGSDIGPLKKLGTSLCGLSPDSQRYFDLHHAATDVFEAVSRRELLLGAGNMAALIWLVSENGL
jgi:hypothetical protein